MDLKKRLLEDFKIAMKEKDNLRKNTITMIRAAILQREKDEQIELDDDGVIEVLSSELKKREASLEAAEKGNRLDMVDDIKTEMAIIKDYLPQQLTEDEIDDIVAKTIEELGANGMKDMGKVMGVLMPKLKGRADGKLVNQITRKHLQ
ncbi:MAG TPA: GatB/YqeY domain-containing protein [Clostridiales bacterium]|nr:GatB/YqeY domain-containing protein [Clostridiales bacterium]